MADEKTVAAEASIKAAALKVAPRAKRVLLAKSLDEDVTKTLLQGHAGVGKTRALAEVMQTKLTDGRNPRVFVASTDIGGNGLRTVKDRLLAVGRADLLPNIVYTDFQNYEDFSGFFTGALVPQVSATQNLWQWDPDVVCQDGLANFQESHVWRYVMSTTPLAKESTDVRDEGIYAGQAEWGQIRKVTTLSLDMFLRLANPLTGKVPNKIVTVLMDNGKEDKITNDTKKGPLILGAARSYITAAFDYIVTLKAVTLPGSKVPTYSYDCNIGGTNVAKARGGEFCKLPAEALAKANFQELWTAMTAVTQAAPAASV